MVPFLIFVLMYIIIGIIIYLGVGRWGIDSENIGEYSKKDLFWLTLFQILLWLPSLIIFWCFMDHFNNNKKDQ